VVLIFSQKADDNLASLVKKLDAEVAKAGKGKMCAAVVFLSDDDSMKEKIEKFKGLPEIDAARKKFAELGGTV